MTDLIHMSPLGNIVTRNGSKIVFRSPGGEIPRELCTCWVPTTDAVKALEVQRGTFYKSLNAHCIKIHYPGTEGMTTEKTRGSNCGFITFENFVTIAVEFRNGAGRAIVEELAAHCERILEHKAQKKDGLLFTNGGYKKAAEFIKRALMPVKEKKHLQWEEQRQQKDVEYYWFLSDCLKWGRYHPRKQYFTFQLVEWEDVFGGYNRRQVEAWSRRAAEEGFFDSPRKGVVDIAQVTYTGERVNIYDFSRRFLQIENVFDNWGEDDFFRHRWSMGTELYKRLKTAAEFGATQFNLPMLCLLINEFMVSDAIRAVVSECKAMYPDFDWNWKDDTKMILVRCH